MFFSSAFLVSILAITTVGSPLTIRDNDLDNDGGLQRICPYLKTKTHDNGCIRYTRGFDVTGVLTEVDLAFPTIQDECDCIQQCLDRLGTCANYVWKFSTPESVMSGHRTCTLYSNFNIPANVTIAFDVNNPANQNIQVLAPSNNPQQGALVPQAFKDVNLNTTADPHAVSGPVWTLANGLVQC